jgi:hypothetical protein
MVPAIAAPVIIPMIATIAVAVSAPVMMVARRSAVSVAVTIAVPALLQALLAGVCGKLLSLAGGLHAFRSRTGEAGRAERESKSARDNPN